MPITQHRMIRLIDAAQGIINNWKNIVESNKFSQSDKEITQAANDGDVNRLVGLYDGLVERVREMISVEAIMVVTEERVHFNSRKNLNDRSRVHMRFARLHEKQVEAIELDEEMTASARNSSHNNITDESEEQVLIERMHNLIFMYYTKVKQDMSRGDLVDPISRQFKITSIEEQTRLLIKLQEQGRIRIIPEGPQGGNIIPVEPSKYDLGERAN